MTAKRLSDRELMKVLDVDAATLKMFKRVRKDAMKEAGGMRRPRTGKIKVLGISGSQGTRRTWSGKTPTPRNC